jgi:hypothetical protein
MLEVEVAADALDLRGSLRQRDVRLQARAHDQPGADTFGQGCRALSVERGAQGERQPQVRGKNPGALKPRRRHADHFERMSIESDGATDDRWIAIEPALPECMTDDHDRTGAGVLAVARTKQSPGNWLDAERREIVRRDLLALHAFRAGASCLTGLQGDRVREHRESVHRLERGRPLAQIEIGRVGPGIESAVGTADADIHQAVRLDDANRRPQEQRVGDGEHRSVCADSNAQRDRRRGRHDRLTAKQPHRVPGIAPRIIQPREGSSVPMELLRLLDAAEGHPRLAPGILAGEALSPEVFLNQRKMRGELARQFLFHVPRPDNTDKSREEALESRHHSDSVRSFSTSPAIRRQRSVCSPSARVPAFVMP